MVVGEDGTSLVDEASLSFLRDFLTFAREVAEVSQQGQDLGKRVRDFPCSWGMPGLAVIQFIWLLTTSLKQSSSFQISTKPNLQAGNPSPANRAAPSPTAAQHHR